jgi:G6PDH family F420-dependent oxidoreductase
VTTFGYFLSCEEYGPKELVRQARMAEQAGFEALWISDHFHPWNSEQGQSPFVWSVIGALSEAVSLPVTTAVTCPTIRMHPAVVAQAAATAAVQLDGKFVLGVGSGEALNEHILGDAWPSAGQRLEMLEEAVHLIRELHKGEEISHHGTYYDVVDAQIWTRPDKPVPIYVSAFGPQATELAARIADGYCNTSPDAELIHLYREAGGKGPAQAGMKVCWAPTEEEGVRTARRVWGNSLLGGQLAQTLPRPQDFEAAVEPIGEEAAAEKYACGPDAKVHIEAARPYLEAGFDELYVSQIGGHHEEFFELWAGEVLPALR